MHVILPQSPVLTHVTGSSDGKVIKETWLEVTPTTVQDQVWHPFFCPRENTPPLLWALESWSTNYSDPLDDPGKIDAMPIVSEKAKEGSEREREDLPGVRPCDGHFTHCFIIALQSG